MHYIKLTVGAWKRAHDIKHVLCSLFGYCVVLYGFHMSLHCARVHLYVFVCSLYRTWTVDVICASVRLHVRVCLCVRMSL